MLKLTVHIKRERSLHGMRPRMIAGAARERRSDVLSGERADAQDAAHGAVRQRLRRSVRLDLVSEPFHPGPGST